MIGRTAKLQCKPFKNTHEEQIKLVSSFEWLDISKLNGIEEEFRELVRASIFIDNIRCDAICKAMKERVNSLKKVIDNSGNKEYYSVADVKEMLRKIFLIVGNRLHVIKFYFSNTLWLSKSD